MKYVIGIDPDSKSHGVAIYMDGKLKTLTNWTLPEIISFVNPEEVRGCCVISIEDTTAKKCVYRQHSINKARAQGEIGRRLGMCQQSQIELERVLEFMGIPVIRHKPQSGNWADKKNLFEKVTGWVKRSNKDTRSAAYFGYVGLNLSKSQALEPAPR